MRSRPTARREFDRDQRTAQAYAERFPLEIQTMLADSQRPLAQLRELYPFLRTAPKSA